MEATLCVTVCWIDLANIWKNCRNFLEESFTAKATMITIDCIIFLFIKILKHSYKKTLTIICFTLYVLLALVKGI